MRPQRFVAYRSLVIHTGVLILVGWSCVMAGEWGADLFGKPVTYSSSARIDYPDFTVRFIGTRRQASTVYPRGFLYHDFEVRSKAGNETTVSWSSGTGELGPVEFSMDGQHYFLELKANSLETDPKRRWLKEDELIIWKKEVYLEKQKALRARLGSRPDGP